ncbi:MAG: ABC transporter permease [Gemmataceae bacterium]|nr:ABC transporter permease [Gemmataceae bacterium]
MDGLAPSRPVAINRWLPYWAVLQADFQQTLQSWVYRVWVLVSLLAAGGYILYRFGLMHEVGIEQSAAKLIADLLRWSLLGSVSLIVVLTAGAISSERGTMADSVLSRGISRHQYFLGKWHSRLASVVLTFLTVSCAALAASAFLLKEDLSWRGCGVALATVSCMLAAVVSCGVAVSAVANSTVLGIAVLWVLLYGGGFLLSLLPARYLSPDRALTSLPYILQGHYDMEGLGRLMLGCGAVSLAAALAGLWHFSRRDI